MNPPSKTIKITSTKRQSFKDDIKPWIILVIDDEQSVLDVTDNILKRFTFKDRPLQLEYAKSFDGAKRLYQQHPNAAVAIVDCTMEKDTSGLDFVDYIRNQECNTSIQLVLRTGQPGFAPEHQVLVDYEINDYLAKTELTSAKLKHRMISYLRAYESVIVIAEKNIQLQQLNKIKDNFLSVVSHELRCPLSAATGLLALMREEYSADKDIVEDIELVESCNQHMDLLVGDLIDSAMIRRDEFRMSFHEHCFAKLAEDIMPNIHMLAKYLQRDNTVNIQLQIPQDLPPVHIDKGRIQQVMINLLHNALKFTESGSITVVAKADEQQLRISIIDTGVGIDTQHSKHIFSAFTQVDSAKSLSPEGLGLGLSIVKKIIDGHKGSITVANRQEGGCVFTFTLPTV